MITTRHLAYMDGRHWTLVQKRKPSEKAITEACPFTYTEPGTPEDDRKHENGRRTAWLAGATEAREDHVPASKLKIITRTPRAERRAARHQARKLEKKGYTLAL